MVLEGLAAIVYYRGEKVKDIMKSPKTEEYLSAHGDAEPRLHHHKLRADKGKGRHRLRKVEKKIRLQKGGNSDSLPGGGVSCRLGEGQKDQSRRQ